MRLFGQILFESDKEVAEFVQKRIAAMKGPFVNYVALGVVHNGRLAGGVVYHDNVGHDIFASAAFTTLRWWNPQTVRSLFAYPFLNNESARVSMKTSANNVRARRMIERLGFKQEGYHPLAINGTEDAVSYGMTRDDCFWLKD